jgi:hypothetical protein
MEFSLVLVLILIIYYLFSVSSVYESVTKGTMLVSENNDYPEKILSKR